MTRTPPLLLLLLTLLVSLLLPLRLLGFRTKTLGFTQFISKHQ